MGATSLGEDMPAKSRKLIYIMGLSHSGSTVLDMLLTTAGKAVGLGQVWTVLRERPDLARERICSCGEQARACAFWGPVIERLAALPSEASAGERYREVLRSVDHLYGPDMAVVNSSKHAEYLEALVNQVPRLDLTVLHNVKDVRAFTVSMLDNLWRKEGRRYLPEKIFYQWYRDNRACYALARRTLERSPLRVMYEGVCLTTQAASRQLAEFLEEDFIDLDAPLDRRHTHVIAGNRLRLPQNGTGKRLTYDFRWLLRPEWLRPYMLLPMVRRYNDECLQELRASLTFL